MATLEKGKILITKEKQAYAKRGGPFKVLEKVNNNANKLELPADMGVSPTLNIGDLTPYLKDEDDGDNLRANHNQAREEVAHFSPRELTSPS